MFVTERSNTQLRRLYISVSFSRYDSFFKIFQLAIG